MLFAYSLCMALVSELFKLAAELLSFDSWINGALENISNMKR